MKKLVMGIAIACSIFGPESNAALKTAADLKLMGLIAPVVNDPNTSIPIPQLGEIVFDYTNTVFAGWDGTNWVTLSGGSTTSTVISDAPNQRIERVKVATNCTTSPCTITAQSGSWVSSITRSGSGSYTINITSGIFSSTPTCTCSSREVGTSGRRVCSVQIDLNTSTTVLLETWKADNNATQGSNADTAFDVICMGEK